MTIKTSKTGTASASGAAKSKKVPTFVKLALTPQVAKLGAVLSGNTAPSAQTLVQVQGNMNGGDLYIVKIDGIKVGMSNDHGSKPVSAGDHWLTTDLVGDVGATVTVIATVNGAQVAACTCAVVDGSNPPRHADCADDFTT
jgi:hypothetical protein